MKKCNMLFYFLLLLISVHGNTDVNFKITKSLDVKLESNSNISNQDVNEIIKHEINKNCDDAASNKRQTTRNDGENEEIDSTTSIDPRIVDRRSLFYPEWNTDCYFAFCESLVGTSKIPPCPQKRKLKSNNTKKNIPKSCKEIQEKGQNVSGIYEIQPRPGNEPFNVLCDMETRGGGWVHIQNRFDGSQNFYLDWRDYKFGFGDLNGEFWIGLENIYLITGYDSTELLIELSDKDKTKAYASYKSFRIGPEPDGYPLTVLSGFSGDAGDALTYHLQSKFSTKDFDQDNHSSHCAQVYSGAWWYNACHYSSLNGKFSNVVLPSAYNLQGIHWNGFKGHTYNLAGTRMLVRPIDN